MPGDRIVQLDTVGTTVFTVSAVLAAVVFDGVARAQGVVVSMTLFAVGTFVFLWGYWTAVQRSRTEQISVAEMYFLLGPAIPTAVKRRLNMLLLVQTVVAVATASARPSTDGRAGSTLAFGVLVPMFGLGLNGLWAARHGSFGPRVRRDGTTGATPSDSTSDTTSDTTSEMPGGTTGMD